MTSTLVILCRVAAFFASCRKDQFITDASAKLAFSTDTVLFDTIFTTYATANKVLKVYNPHNKSIKSTSLRLAGGAASFYKINVNGVNGTTFSDLELYPNDSMYIFVAAKIDQVGQDKPLLVSDSLIFVTNSNEQKIRLISYGQDVNVLKNAHISTSTWTSDKPYLIFGTLTVDSNQTLTMQPGTRVYMYNNAGMVVYGSLVINGTKDNRALIQHSRPEPYYMVVPGQGSKIILMDCSKNNLIEYTDIYSPVLGLQVGEPDKSSKPDLVIRNSMIINAKLDLVQAFGAAITAENCVFANAGRACMALYKGGTYKLYHCSVVNYGIEGIALGKAQLSALYYNDTYSTGDGDYTGSLDELSCYNSIIYGGNGYSVNIIPSSAKYYFKKSSLNFNDKLLPRYDVSHFDSIMDAQPMLKRPTLSDPDKDTYDFTPDSLSKVRDTASLSISKLYPVDMNGKDRFTDGKPDLGAIEWFPKAAK